MTLKKKISEEEIDNIVVRQANCDSAWEKPIHVCKTDSSSAFVVIYGNHIHIVCLG